MGAAPDREAGRDVVRTGVAPSATGWLRPGSPIPYGAMAESDSSRNEEDPTRRHFEQVIGAAAPLLDLVLAVGDRISRIAEPVDYEYYPVRDPDAEEESGDGRESPDRSAL